MILVTTSHGGTGNGWQSEETREPSGDGVNRFEHYSTGLGGLVATILVLFVWYPTLAGVVEPLQTLSSTAIVAFGVVSWALTWFALELFWEWRFR